MVDIIIPFSSCLSKIKVENAYIETIFEDDTKVPALPQYNPVSLFTSHDLGYEDDIKRMTIDHELLHTFLSEFAGLKYSPTLWSVAHQQNLEVEGVIEIWRQYEEEALVLSFQKYLKKKVVEPPLEYYLSVVKTPVRKLKVEALTLLDF